MTKLVRKPLFRGAASGFTLLVLSACGPHTIAQVGPASTQGVAALGQQDYASEIAVDYVLRPADTIRINVFREPDLSLEEVVISADGRVSVPLLGPLIVSGMTLGELEGQLEQAFGARYLRDPDVAVNVLSYDSHRVTVEGAVQEPGLFPFEPGTRLSGGIALAQGATRVAAIREVAIFRQSPEGLEVAKFDYAAVREGTMLDPVLEPGDRIVVGTSMLSQFWQDVLRSIPIFALFTRI